MRIGVLPGSPAKGGVYQYSLSVLDALDPASAAREGDELVVLGDEADGLDLESLAARGWRVAPASPPMTAVPVDSAGRWRPRRVLGALRRRVRRHADEAPRPDVIRGRPDVAAWHAELGIDLMIYPNPTTISFEAGTPYVTAVHDLQHRLQPEFPEVSANGESEWREYLYRNAIAQAVLILADSEIGREDVLEHYGELDVPEDRVKVLPHAVPPYLLEAGRPDQPTIDAVRRRYSLPDRYFFYPAQYWPHKNHVRLVRALAALQHDHGVQATLVLSGRHSGGIRDATRAEMLTEARTEGVAGRVIELGAVPNGDMASLYAGAVALTMPTFFGPTNIPILEAWAVGCPVLTSDIRGIREQTGDAGVLVDPTSVGAIAQGMAMLWNDEGLRCWLVERGEARLAAHGPEQFRDGLTGIVREAKDRLRKGVVAR